MSSVLRSAITGVGGYLPEKIVTNDDLAKYVDTNDAWIVERTGIHSRRQAVEGEATSDLATAAALKALAAAGRTAPNVSTAAPSPAVEKPALRKKPRRSTTPEDRPPSTDCRRPFWTSAS